MNNTYSETVRNAKIFWTFIQRDMKVLRTTVKDMLINGAIFVTLQTLLYAYLLPVMGMPAERILPLYLGIIIILMTMIGFHKSFRIMNDRDKSKFIEYQLLLLPKKWLLLEYAVVFCIEFAIQAMLPFTFFALLIGPGLNLYSVSWASLALIVSMTLLFFSTLFLTLCMALPTQWFFDNLWPRLLTPIILLGTANYPLDRVQHISPLLGKLFLLNPSTYVIEGLRAVLVPGATSLSLTTCVSALTVYICISVAVLIVGIRATLDPV